MKLIFIITLIVCLGITSKGNIMNLQNNHFAVISGKLDATNACDTLRLVIKEDLSYFSTVVPNRIYKVPVKDGKFKFKIADGIHFPVYFDIDSNRSPYKDSNRIYPMIAAYLMEDNDSIYMEFKNNDIQFFGRGADKYRCRMAMDTDGLAANKSIGLYNTVLNEVLFDLHRDSLISGIEFMNRWYSSQAKSINISRNGKLSILNSFRPKLSPDIYKVLYLDMMASEQHKMYSPIFLNYAGLISKYDSLDSLKRIFQSSMRELTDVPDSVSSFSWAYTGYVLDKEVVDYFLKDHKYDLDTLYLILKNKYGGLLREKLIAYYIYSYYNKFKNGDRLVNDALATVVKKAPYRDLLVRTKYTIEGARAYDFQLYDESGKSVRLSDYKGKVVFLDFYFKGCGGCVLYYKNVVSKVKEKLKDNLNVVFMAVSIDKYKNNWLDAIKSGDYTSAQSVNLYTGGIGTEHPVIQKNFITSYPTPILIDKQGKVFKRYAPALGLGGIGNYDEKINRLLDQIHKASVME